MRVLIADHGLIRLGIRRALEGDDGLNVCAEAPDAHSAITAAQLTQPDVSLIGWEIPGGGLTAVRAICDSGLGSVVVVSSTHRVEDLLAAVRAGAIGFVPGDSTPQGLRSVVRAVHAHEAAVPRSMVRDLLCELRAMALGPAPTTGREAQVLDGLRRGDTTAVIANRLGISPVTVRRHISDLVRKLGVENRAALVHRESS